MHPDYIGRTSQARAFMSSYYILLNYWTTQDMLIKRTKCLSFHFICCSTSNLCGVFFGLILLSHIILDIAPKMCEPLTKIHLAILCRKMCRCSSISEWMHALYSTIVLCNQLTYFPDKTGQAASFPNGKTCHSFIKWIRCWWHVVSIWATHSRCSPFSALFQVTRTCRRSRQGG